MNEITIERIDQRTALVRLGPRLDNTTAAAVRDSLTDLHADGVNRYVIDMSAVEFFDSTGLSVIFRAWRRAVHADGGLVLAAPSAPVRTALTTAQIPAPVDDDLATALARTRATV